MGEGGTGRAKGLENSHGPQVTWKVMETFCVTDQTDANYRPTDIIQVTYFDNRH